jgi:small subunit ribosomal protein S9
MPEDPQMPDRPEDEALEGPPGEPGETTPAESQGAAGEPGDTTPVEPGETTPSEPEGAAGEPGETTPAEPEPEPGEDAAPDAGAPGPEIEGVEELAEAARPKGAGEEAPEAEGAAQPEEAGAAAEAPEAFEAPAPDEAEPAAEAPPAEPGEERPRPQRRRPRQDRPTEEVIPGAHLEPDLVLEEEAPQEGEYGEYGEYADAEAAVEEPEPVEEPPTEPAPVTRQPLDLAADARYRATGKRKSAVARVILKPGEGTYRVNGRHLDEYFPRVLLQRMARQPLEAAGYHTRMDVVARIHGGGVSAQATALRHGVARALVEADPALRSELKRRGYLTRDPRVKERKKAGLKKARKRPQFSKR